MEYNADARCMARDMRDARQGSYAMQVKADVGFKETQMRDSRQGK
jgi:hypothetical protein